MMNRNEKIETLKEIRSDLKGIEINTDDLVIERHLKDLRMRTTQLLHNYED